MTTNTEALRRAVTQEPVTLIHKARVLELIEEFASAPAQPVPDEPVSTQYLREQVAKQMDGVRAALASAPAQPVAMTDDELSAAMCGYGRLKDGEYKLAGMRPNSVMNDGELHPLFTFTEEQLERLNAALSAQAAPKVPEGWQLMPIEPPDEMLDAWRAAFHKQLHRRTNSRGKLKPHAGRLESCEKAAYRAMLAVAPPPEAKAQAVPEVRPRRAAKPVARVTEFVGAIRIEAECLPHHGERMKIGDMLYAAPQPAPSEQTPPTLPPLPEHEGFADQSLGGWQCYSADQMREYAQAAIALNAKG